MAQQQQRYDFRMEQRRKPDKWKNELENSFDQSTLKSVFVTTVRQVVGRRTFGQKVGQFVPTFVATVTRHATPLGSLVPHHGHVRGWIRVLTQQKEGASDIIKRFKIDNMLRVIYTSAKC